MLIQCTACGAQAKIPDSKEGAKVRCPSCSHVFVARRPGARGKSKEDPTKYFIIGGAVLVGVVLIVIATGGEDPPPPEPEPEEEVVETPMVDEYGWDSPAVKTVRALHDAALADNTQKLESSLVPEMAYDDWVVRELEANAKAIADAEAYNAELGEGVEPTPVPDVTTFAAWDELDALGQRDFIDGRVAAMLSDDPDNLVRQWSPLDGHVTLLEGTDAVVSLMVKRREGELEERTIIWRLFNTSGRFGENAVWKVVGWNRDPAEMAEKAKRRTKKTTKKTLSDGSLVIESEIRPIEFDPEVPQAERDRINKLVQQRVDLSSRPRPRTEANTDLVAIGKPAIAALLTFIAKTEPIDNEDEAIQLQLIHDTLGEITGYITTYKVDVSLGTTEERRDSGLKQWFGWYDRKYKKFKGVDLGEDPLLDDPDWQPRTERERMEFERLRRERQGG